MKKKSSPRKWWIIGGVSVLAIVGLVLWLRPKAAPEVTVKLERGDLVEAAYAVGTVKADHVFNLKTGVSTRMLERFVRLGDPVKKGAPLVNLDGFPVYRAPYDGVVTALTYDVGELVFANTVVLTVVQADALYLELSMDERVVGGVRKGQKARISFEGQRGAKAREGVVRSIYANEGQFLVILDFDREGLALLPGMTADVALMVAEHKDKLLLPLGAMTATGEVTVVRGDKTATIRVVPGPSDGNYTAIESSELKEGDTVRLVKEKTRGGPGGMPMPR